MSGVTPSQGPGQAPGTGSAAGSGVAEEQLRDVFDALVTSVHGASNRYPAALADWRRRERRRRIVLAILAAVIFALADIIGLWALSRADVNIHIIFDDRPGSSTEAPRTGIGPPP
ncbi:hypothetical protein ABZS66_18805 [Dactylosporangium sp. NPDC005572]|uniref:hypothetical protein n=1 Tax=Dactylosporangium sp. NPDC005572 TaxID=3156889 RepID=UPI0033A6915E